MKRAGASAPLLLGVRRRSTVVRVPKPSTAEWPADGRARILEGPTAAQGADRGGQRSRAPLESTELARFEATILPHLDAAYTLARYLTRDPHEADDAVQDACLRALRYFDTFRGGDARAWLLAIVRNRCYSLRHQRRDASTVAFDEALHSETVDVETADAAALRTAARESLEEALRRLPEEFREVIVLRELRGLSYKEISEVAGVPIGTVMSRLSRARQRLQHALGPESAETP
jgi:RNA polymerase sigma-70 factor (ECF subfamily)